MKTLYILSGFNNYYNRMVKLPGDERGDYPQALYTLEATNFVPNDGVNTEHVIGTYDYTGEGDYLLVTEQVQVPIDNNDPPTLAWKEMVVQRWFIIDSIRLKNGQYALTLRRDLIADYYSHLLDAPMYVEKATVRDDDPAIWNSEGVSVNQIKTSEQLLKDDTQCAWIVGYVNRDMDEPVTMSFDTYVQPDLVTDSIETWEYYNESIGVIVAKNATPTISFKIQSGVKDNKKAFSINFNNATDGWYYESAAIESNPPFTGGSLAYQEIVNKLNELCKGTTAGTELENLIPLYITSPGLFDTNRFNEIQNLKGKYIQDNTTKIIYKINTEVNTIFKYDDVILGNKGVINNTPGIETFLNNAIESINSPTVGVPAVNLNIVSESITITLEQTNIDKFALTIPSKNDRLHLIDAPYDMFCLCVNPGNSKVNVFSYKGAEVTLADEISKTAIINIAQGIAENLGKNLYDLQLVPYCPLTNYSASTSSVTGTTTVQINCYQTEKSYTDIFRPDQENTFNVFYTTLHWCTTSSNSKNLPFTPIQMDNKKLTNECNMYRLCSPNYNGQFQFNISKMNGLNGFNVDYTYLPYSPYIHVNPWFAGLYGEDFDDARGLICQGDFSISYLSDAWTEYQIQNKNFANIFARQKSHLETTQEVQRNQQIFNAITGTVMGGSIGVSAGSKGGIPGMITGGLLGTASSALGGAMDVHYGDILRNEALSYHQDMYNYQLDNIQAMPDSIAKTTAYTNNNKIFPVLEYYTCTDVEKRAIANKIAYNGMTVMRIGTMNEFIGNSWSYNGIESQGYIKGKLIRLETIEDDYHVINALSGELDKGVFIK